MLVVATETGSTYGFQAGGTHHNIILERFLVSNFIHLNFVQTVGQLADLPQGVYCMDHYGGRAPRVLVSSGSKIHVLKLEKRQ